MLVVIPARQVKLANFSQQVGEISILEDQFQDLFLALHTSDDNSQPGRLRVRPQGRQKSYPLPHPNCISGIRSSARSARRPCRCLPTARDDSRPAVLSNVFLGHIRHLALG